MAASRCAAPARAGRSAPARWPRARHRRPRAGSRRRVRRGPSRAQAGARGEPRRGGPRRVRSRSGTGPGKGRAPPSPRAAADRAAPRRASACRRRRARSSASAAATKRSRARGSAGCRRSSAASSPATCRPRRVQQGSPRSPSRASFDPLRQRRVLPRQGREAHLGARDPPLDGRQRDAAGRRRLGQLHPLDEAQREGQALVDRQRVEDRVGGPEGLGHLGAGARRRDLGHLVPGEEAQPAPPRPPAEERPRREDGDRRHPGPERARVPDPVERAQRADEHVLVQVGDLVPGAEDAEEEMRRTSAW